MKNYKILLTILVSLALVACAGDDKNSGPRTDTGVKTPVGGDDNKVITEGYNGMYRSDGTPIRQGEQYGYPVFDKDGNILYATAFDDPNNPLSSSVIYFDLDSATVRDRDMAVLNAHAKYLTSNPGARARLEGHADERGSREYNVALSENRAQSVRRLMTFQGMNAARTKIVSYGEEKPVEFCQSERCWSQNRRVEIVYEAK